MTRQKQRRLSKSPVRPSEVLDLRGLKAGVCRLLEPEHPLRIAVMQEPDQLPRAQGIARLQAYARLALALRRP